MLKTGGNAQKSGGGMDLIEILGVSKRQENKKLIGVVRWEKEQIKGKHSISGETNQKPRGRLPPDILEKLTDILKGGGQWGVRPHGWVIVRRVVTKKAVILDQRAASAGCESKRWKLAHGR